MCASSRRVLLKISLSSKNSEILPKLSLNICGGGKRCSRGLISADRKVAFISLSAVYSLRGISLPVLLM